LILDKNVALQLLAQALLGSIKPFLHHKLLRLSLLDLAARPPFLRLHMGPLDRLEAHLNLDALDHLEALQDLVPLQYFRLPSHSSHPHVDTLSDAVNS